MRRLPLALAVAVLAVTVGFVVMARAVMCGYDALDRRRP